MFWVDELVEIWVLEDLEWGQTLLSIVYEDFG